MNLIRIFNREKTLLTTLKNKQNVDDLLVEIENNLVSDAKTTTHFFNDDMPDNIKPKLDTFSSFQQVSVPVWQVGPIGLTEINRESLSQSFLISTKFKKLPLCPIVASRLLAYGAAHLV